MATAATAENAAENKKIETDMVQTTMSVFFVHDLRNLFKMDKFAKTRKKLLTTLVSNGKLFAEC